MFLRTGTADFCCYANEASTRLGLLVVHHTLRFSYHIFNKFVTNDRQKSTLLIMSSQHIHALNYQEASSEPYTLSPSTAFVNFGTTLYHIPNMRLLSTVTVVITQRRTISSGLRMPNCTRLTSRNGADESDTSAIL